MKQQRQKWKSNNGEDEQNYFTWFREKSPET